MKVKLVMVDLDEKEMGSNASVAPLKILKKTNMG